MKVKVLKLAYNTYHLWNESQDLWQNKHVLYDAGSRMKNNN